MSAPPVDAGRRAPAPTGTDAGPGRLACSLQSLRGRLSRARAPEAAASQGESAAGTAGTAQNGERRACEQPRRESGASAAERRTRAGPEAAENRQTSGASAARGDDGAPPRDAYAGEDGEHASVSASRASESPRVGSELAAGSSSSSTTTAATLAAAAGAGASERSSEGAAASDSASPSSEESHEPAPEKPHVCGSFFSPCCSARRAGAGVKTFSGAPAATSGAPAASSGADRRRSPVSLARILARPVFATSPPPPARKKSSVVYFHPEFQPGVIGEDDTTDSGSPRSVRGGFPWMVIHLFIHSFIAYMYELTTQASHIRCGDYGFVLGLPKCHNQRLAKEHPFIFTVGEEVDFYVHSFAQSLIVTVVLKLLFFGDLLLPRR